MDKWLLANRFINKSINKINMKKIPTVTIGIPAYNEEGNIHHLLLSLLKQNYQGIKLEQILIISDGSTDNTVSEVKKIKSKFINLIDRKKRLGIIKTQNQLLKHVKSDILVMLDADILPLGENFIQKLAYPLLKDSSVGIVGAGTKSIKPNTLIEKILSQSHEMKNSFYTKINNGDNIYMCHGRARAFSAKIYKKIVWKGECAEDAFSYLFCIKKGYKFVYQKNATVLFRSPSSLSDHIKQSLRFTYGKKQMEKYFSPEFVKKQYEIPNNLIIQTLLKYLINNTLTISGYILINIYVRIVGLFVKSNYETWNPPISTKKIII